VAPLISNLHCEELVFHSGLRKELPCGVGLIVFETDWTLLTSGGHIFVKTHFQDCDVPSRTTIDLILPFGLESVYP
jgi:hypothetical protein